MTSKLQGIKRQLNEVMILYLKSHVGYIQILGLHLNLLILLYLSCVLKFIFEDTCFILLILHYINSEPAMFFQLC
jgi:hypothetical protein